MSFAHSINNNRERHDLTAHLRGVSDLAAGFAQVFGAEQLARYAGLWHDIGKFHPDFQAYLARCEENPKLRGHGPDHKAAGAELAMRQFPPLSLLVQGHHGGLQSPALKDAWLGEKRRTGAIEQALNLAQKAISDLEPDVPLRPPDFALSDPMAAELFLRLVFSALVDADFLDTERHFKAERAPWRGSAVTTADLWPLMKASQESLIAEMKGGKVNEVREAVYRDCIKAAENPPGFFRLTVPTGGGKTRSAMAFALRHAQMHGLQRVIVAVPFISITEQTASVYQEIFGDAGHAVLEHHSMAEWPDEADGDFHNGPIWDRLAAENWDAPVVVTTTVQLFESLFSNRTSRTRKLHRLARSVIILDEAQALPPRLLKPILDVLRQLVTNYGTTVVLSTATQPAFDSIPVFTDVQATEIIPDPAPLFDALRRVQFEWLTDQPLTSAEIATRLLEQPQALAVFNTKKDALSALDALDPTTRPTESWSDAWEEKLEAALNEAEVLHLSTLLCSAHRRNVLSAIKRRLAAGAVCRVVSTQVIEAGVDLDFPFVMRAMAPLDAIIQAAGRCNREGKLPAPGRVIVFEPAGGGLPQGSYRTGADVTLSLRRAGDLDLNLPEPARRYFERLFSLVDTDAERIQERRRSFNYPEVARYFQMIDDDTYSVVITSYGSRAERQRVEQALEGLRKGTPQARELRRLLQPYVVGLRSRQAEDLRRRGLIEEVRPGLGSWHGGYDAVRGLIPTDMDPDSLVI